MMSVLTPLNSIKSHEQCPVKILVSSPQARYSSLNFRNQSLWSGRLGGSVKLITGAGWGPEASVCMAACPATGWSSLFASWEEFKDSLEAATWELTVLRRSEDTTGVQDTWTTGGALMGVGTFGDAVWFWRRPFNRSSIWRRHSRPSSRWMQYKAAACCVTIVPVRHFSLERWSLARTLSLSRRKCPEFGVSVAIWLHLGLVVSDMQADVGMDQG